MTPITTSGAMTFVSTNGDGPQLLTEAAEFLNALAQIGVTLAVEITLRPATTYTPPPRIVESVQDSGAFLAAVSAPPFSNGELANPTPAAPASQPDAPQWSRMNRDQRAAALDSKGKQISRIIGHAPTMEEFDAYKPADWPKANGLAVVYGGGKWRALTAAWLPS